jgi:MoxR-like ATPase
VPSLPVADEDIRDLELLVRSHHPLILLDEPDEGRILAVLGHLARRLDLPLLRWNSHRGLARVGTDNTQIYKTEAPEQCLAHLTSANAETLAYLSGFVPYLEERGVASRIRELHDALAGHKGAVVLAGAPSDLPPALARLFSTVRLGIPSREAYHRYVSAVLADLKQRMPIRIELTGADVAELLEHLKGLPFYEVRKIVTQAVVEDGVFNRDDLLTVLDAKRQAIQRTGLLEYIPAQEEATELAGLRRLREWLDKRRLAFQDPVGARSAGLTPPRGLLLTGVQGCGKSLCARAIATSWRLPLVRLDPSSLYRKYFGESEQNLRRAIRTAESVAPVVLWIDEIEKAFGGQGDTDGGTSRRILGSFLTWLQEKQESVFVLATSNDISELPPELLRKGRFDEIFFVDLPTAAVREEIFRVHLARRGRAPEDFDLAELAAVTEGFSGAEIEQALVAALYTAFSEGAALSTDHVRQEAQATRPLSVTMAERIEELREWARGRTVPAD